MLLVSIFISPQIVMAERGGISMGGSSQSNNPASNPALNPMSPGVFSENDESETIANSNNVHSEEEYRRAFIITSLIGVIFVGAIFAMLYLIDSRFY